MWRRVGVVKTDVSEERVALIFRVERILDDFLTISLEVLDMKKKNLTFL
jgi:hypothetical protein